MEPPIKIVYYSNVSNNTHKFVGKVTNAAIRIPLRVSDARNFSMDSEYVLVVPTYGGGAEAPAIPKPVRVFLNNPANRDLLRGVIGTGNTNFGEHYCKAADMICNKTGVPLIARVEITGTPEDVEKVKQRLEILYGTD